MSFDINTNIASLQAQNYLRTNSMFQSKTINKVTSGLRIVQSGDDAAGLAIANGFRSDEAVLTQGIQNANSGLSQLQIIDGGMNNISQLLDRARTLATESATGTFTGDRGVLNSEFQNVLTEIDRQSQAIGMNTGGTFARNLSIFVGGGRGTSGAAAITNGSVSLNLAQATVDSQSLGLKGVEAAGVKGTDIGAGSSTTSVAKILADANNQKAVAGYTSFVINGPGFSGATGIALQVNLSGVTDSNTLVTAVNAAIQTAGAGTTQAATAFNNANITAAVNTDVTGKQQLTFNSSSTALQVSAGDQMGNALLGNFGAKAVMTGTDVTNSYTTTGSTDDFLGLSFNGGPVMNFHIGTVVGITAATVATDLNAISSFSANAVASADANHHIIITSANDNAGSSIAVSASTLATSLGLSGTSTVTATTGKSLGQAITVNEGATGTASQVGTIVRFSGGGLASPVSITLGSTATTYALAQTDLINQVIANASLKAAGVSVTAGATSLTFSSNMGQNFSVSAAGDSTTNALGLGDWKQGANNAFDYTTITGGASVTGTTTDKLEFSIAGGAAQEISVTTFTAATGQNLAALINAQIAGNATLAAAGIKATGVAAVAGAITIASTNGTFFRVAEGDNTAANQILGFGGGTSTNTLVASGNSGVQTSAATSGTNDFYFNAGGASATNVFQFNAIRNGQDSQTLSFSANDASGSAHTLAVTLSNNATSRNGESLDEAIASINSGLQTSNDSTMQTLVAVKDNVLNTDGTVASQGIRFMSSLSAFTVSMSTAGTNGTVGVGKSTDQGVMQTAAQLAGGGTADVSNQSTAQSAVTALSAAVTALGSAQAVVGRGENQFSYAVNLAQSQLTNMASAEASIRDADLASESANLTKAQILVQAGVAALAQANSAPQQVLSLLRG